jgi:uncharacterized Rmd1/YagE family protein
VDTKGYVKMTKSNSEVRILCYKISNELNLAKLASYFDVLYCERNTGYIILDDKAISSIIKVHSIFKFLFVYKYGCIVFVDFSSDEIYSTLGYMETIIGDVDYKLISQFNESVTLSITNKQLITRINDFHCYFDYNKDVLTIACGLISKSTTLATAESELATVLDDADNIVNFLQKARLRINRSRFVSSISHMARFQCDAIKSLGLFNSGFEHKRISNNKSFYSVLYLYYEIDDRINILERKIDEVNRLISSYTTLSYNMEEMRLLIFECVLLFLFLLPHFIDFKAFFK